MSTIQTGTYEKYGAPAEFRYDKRRDYGSQQNAALPAKCNP